MPFFILQWTALHLSAEETRIREAQYSETMLMSMSWCRANTVAGKHAYLYDTLCFLPQCDQLQDLFWPWALLHSSKSWVNTTSANASRGVFLGLVFGGVFHLGCCSLRSCGTGWLRISRLCIVLWWFFLRRHLLRLGETSFAIRSVFLFIWS